MDATLDALYNIILRGIPTFLLVLLLHFFLKSTFFQPMEKLLKERYDATVGARKKAAEAVARAEQKAAEYEAAITKARTEIYKLNEEKRKALAEEMSARFAEERKAAETKLGEAKADVVAQIATARQGLLGETEAIAETITASILRRTA
jgi:F-type H+-transporting ATPase subunit b